MGRRAVLLPISLKELKHRYVVGETQKELAVACGVSESVICRRLRGVRKAFVFSPGTPCRRVGCSARSVKNGYCRIHYDQLRVRGAFSRKGKCCVAGCERRSTIRGYCNAHYVRLARGNEMSSPVRVVAPKGSGYIDSEGYRRIGKRKEHRLVMEQTLGRPLLPDENVHHLNGDKTDNCPENLELWMNRRQPRGARVRDRIADALVILRRYAPEKLVRSERKN
jgi:hypothetical protein